MKLFPDATVGVAPVRENDGTLGTVDEEGAEVELPNLNLHAGRASAMS